MNWTKQGMDNLVSLCKQKNVTWVTIARFITILEQVGEMLVRMDTWLEQGVKRFPGDDSCAYTYWVFPATMTDDQVWDTLGMCEDSHYYGGPGRGFRHAPSLRRRGSRVLVTQCCGLDI